MNVIGVLRGGVSQEYPHNRQALQHYARGHGLGDSISVIEVSDRASFLAALHGLEPGDVAIIPMLDELGDTPSEIEAEVKRVLGKGVDLHTPWGIGRVGPEFKLLQLAWRHGKAVEAALAEEREKRAADGEEWARTFEAFQRQVGLAITKRWGVLALRDFDAIDIPQEVVERAPALPAESMAQADYVLIGEFIKSERVARSWTQQILAEQMGYHAQQSDKDARTPNVSVVSRMESGEHAGKGPWVRTALEVLDPGVLPDEQFAAIYGDNWPLYVSGMIRARKARARELFDAELAEYAARQPEPQGKPNGIAEPNPFEVATKLAGQLGTAAAEGMEATP